ncbi:MAG TPA: Rnf-Nqr domain containing protein, partial [Rhodocyclaceae bacterium]
TMIGGVREILGSGTLLGISLFGPNFQPWVVMVLPPGGFFVMGGWLLAFAIWRKYRDKIMSTNTEESVHGA